MKDKIQILLLLKSSIKKIIQENKNFIFFIRFFIEKMFYIQKNNYIQLRFIFKICRDFNACNLKCVLLFSSTYKIMKIINIINRHIIYLL